MSVLINRRGNPIALEDPLVQKLAKQYGKTPAQVRQQMHSEVYCYVVGNHI
jgi:diketogulonate reductase-like aldo/keto reductase